MCGKALGPPETRFHPTIENRSASRATQSHAQISATFKPRPNHCVVAWPREKCGLTSILMTDADRLTPALPQDIADVLAFALRFDGRKRKSDAAEMMARIVAERLVRHLTRCGFLILKKPPIGGTAAPRCGDDL